MLMRSMVNGLAMNSVSIQYFIGGSGRSGDLRRGTIVARKRQLPTLIRPSFSRLSAADSRSSPTMTDRPCANGIFKDAALPEAL
jgi:hypothetical protein